jgi:FSR family fosmidomycin resistance protein-like MFS transporter
MGTHGAAWLTEHETDAVAADYVITESGGIPVPTPAGVRRPVIVGEKGSYWCVLRVRGTPGHASQPLLTDNALVRAAEVVRRIDAFRPEAAIHEVWRRFVDGMALGPVLTTPFVLIFGLPGTLFLALPAAVMAAVLSHEMPRMLRFKPEEVESGGREPVAAPEHWGPFARMVGIVVVRSFVYFGLVAFVAAYYERVLGTSPAFGNAALAVMLAAGAAGTLIMGPLADRFGRRTIVSASMLLLPPLIFGFTLSGPLQGMALLALVGATTVGTFGVTVVMGQEYLPGRIGLAAGITMGLSIGLGGGGAPLLGFLADRAGLPVTMLVIAALPLLGLLLSFTLPRKVPATPGT